LRVSGGRRRRRRQRQEDLSLIFKFAILIWKVLNVLRSFFFFKKLCCILVA
jgi:hypothetical protein